jgi:hypothetical protein
MPLIAMIRSAFCSAGKFSTITVAIRSIKAEKGSCSEKAALRALAR